MAQNKSETLLSGLQVRIKIARKEEAKYRNSDKVCFINYIKNLFYLLCLVGCLMPARDV